MPPPSSPSRLRAPLESCAPRSLAALVTARTMGGLTLAGLTMAALALAGCVSPKEAREAADAEVYALVAERRSGLGMPERAFTILPPAESLRRRVLASREADVLSPELAAELDALTLTEALEIAAENSRRFQDRRERLYLTALDLTLERWRFGWQPTAGGGASLVGNAEESLSFAADLSATLTRLFGSGAQLIADVGLSLFDDLNTIGDGDLVSNFALSVTQPLMAGFGARITLEPLTQAERNLVYEVRAYERFRRTFAVDVATRYLRILQQRDSLKNATANAESLARVRERNEALATAGRLSDIQLDQARQDELRAQVNVIDARQSFESSIDDFNLFLGLPIGTPLTLDPQALELLLDDERWGTWEFSKQAAIDLALERRLDNRNAADVVIDTERRVGIAADALRTVLNLNVTADGASKEGDLFDYRQQNVEWQVGLGLDLPFNRLPERNNYRAALITRQAAIRAAAESVDTVQVEVRDALRELASRRDSYRIQERSVELAERRVQSAAKNLEAGRAQTRDLLEAQDSLVAAQNARTGALIDLRLALLALLRDTETLRVDANGLSREDFEIQTADAAPESASPEPPAPNGASLESVSGSEREPS